MHGRGTVSPPDTPERNSAFHYQPLLVIHDDLQALDLVTIHCPTQRKKLVRSSSLNSALLSTK
jgi:hypothetical protein